jgi:hypothetical protein
VRDSDFVAELEGHCQLLHEVSGDLFRQRAGLSEPLGQGLSFEVLEEQVRLGEASLRSKSTRRCRRF